MTNRRGSEKWGEIRRERGGEWLSRGERDFSSQDKGRKFNLHF
jgi:hypothetical protein